MKQHINRDILTIFSRRLSAISRHSIINADYKMDFSLPSDISVTITPDLDILFQSDYARKLYVWLIASFGYPSMLLRTFSALFSDSADLPTRVFPRSTVIKTIFPIIHGSPSILEILNAKIYIDDINREKFMQVVKEVDYIYASLN